MTYNTLLYEKEGGIGIVTINRPEALNALNGEVYTDTTFFLIQQGIVSHGCISSLLA